MQTLGSATFTAFIVQAITGVILAMYDRPTPEGAYASIQDITDHVFMGWLVRGMHRWGASVFIILTSGTWAACSCSARTSPARAELDRRRPAAGDGDDGGFTGDLLPWDQTAYRATVVGINLNWTAPLFGPWLAQFLRSGQEIGADTLTRFYSMHMLVIPGAIFGLIGLHMYLVVRLGVTSPPRSKEAAGMEPAETNGHGTLRPGLTRPVTRGRNGSSSGGGV